MVIARYFHWNMKWGKWVLKCGAELSPRINLISEWVNEVATTLSVSKRFSNGTG